LSGELTVALKKGIRKKAKKALREKSAIERLRKKAKNIEEALEIEEVIAVLKKTETDGASIVKFKNFTKKWKGKSIKTLTKKEIVNNLRGYTEQANRIAKLIEDNRIIIKILDNTDFEELLIKYGDTAEEAKATAAFNIGVKNYFRTSTNVSEFMSEIVHEGTHTLDNINKFKATIIQEEKRAFFQERSFQIATGMGQDFETIEELLNFIITNY